MTDFDTDVRSGSHASPRKVAVPQAGGFFDRLARGWEFAKISYGIIWDFKQLLVFPILSGIAALLVFASFILPMWGTGTLEQLAGALDDEGGASQISPVVYVVAFLYYFCSFFVIVYFNTALTACAMKVTAGELPTIGYGLSVASRRVPQIAGWALVSAIVGVVLKAIENAHEKAGRFVSMVLGSGWTVLTFFVVPVLAVEGVGPIQAIKGSFNVLRETWGESLLGNAAMGLISFLVGLPIYLLLGVGVVLALKAQSMALVVLTIAVLVVVIVLHAAAASAADVVFKALLYNYATGRDIPADLDEDVFASAFGSRA